ncbi:MAG: hypothetical protein JWM27_2733 [Gemmatimonadetes bacterium]|nr:hypothetical protein [Gemmatimonadota bacterium]
MRLHISFRTLVYTAAALVALFAVPLAAQQAPRRPPLPDTADVNDWEAYYDYGYKMFKASPERADAAFYWASRLDPERAEPLFGRWAAYWYRWDGRFAEYLQDELKGEDLKEAVRVDSLRLRAMLRNPFVQRDLLVPAYDRLPGRWGDDPATRGILATAQHDYARAVALLNVALQHGSRPWLHEDRAIAFVALGRFDSAKVETETLLAELHRADERRMVRVYESKGVVEYGLGMLNLARRDQPAAREAFGRALTEDLALAPAHAMLGMLALAQRDTAAGFAEYRQAVELAPEDPVLRVRFGDALTGAGRAAEAVEHLRRAVALEPAYAAGYESLGRALAASGERAAALDAYAAYLVRAPRREAARIAAVRRRVEALSAPPAAAPAPTPIP